LPQYLPENISVTESSLPIDNETMNGVGVPAQFTQSNDDLRERGAVVIASKRYVILFWFM